MASTNPFSIQWGSFTAGGSSDVYLLHNPYSLDKAFGSMRVSFDVIVVASDLDDLKTKCDVLEVAFRKRSQNLIINIDGSTWTYTAGTDILNGTSQSNKTGDPASDRGVQRKYTCHITGDLPADDASGLLELHVHHHYEPGRQHMVSMDGVYTSLAGVSASAMYLANFDAVAGGLISGLDHPEMVGENYTFDRLNARCEFSRQYVDLLYKQSSGSFDSTSIRSHRVVFTNLSSHPGDSQENVHRLRRVQCTYDAYADVDVQDDLQSIADDICEPLLLKQFKAEFSPRVFAIEDKRQQFDETAKRIGISVTFVYQPSGGSEVVEVSITNGFREARQIDYTYVHDGDELTAYADPGFLTLERTTQRTVIVVGSESPKRRLAADDEKSKGAAGSMGIEAPQAVTKDGWNRVSNTSTTTPQWIGEPGGDTTPIRVTILSEQVVERFNKSPKASGGAPRPSGGTTPSDPAPIDSRGPTGAITPG